jgi:hypothetical protein
MQLHFLSGYEPGLSTVFDLFNKLPDLRYRYYLYIITTTKIDKMDSSSYKFPKLKGSSNWEIWVLRATAVLIQKGYGEVMRPAKKTQPTEPKYRNPLTLNEDQKKAH